MTETLSERALIFATAAHRGQFRKYTHNPYIEHPMEVAKLVATVYGRSSVRVREAAMATAYLHDVVEDCGVSLATIEELFGKRVCENVFWLTDYSRPEHGNRAFRKQLDRWHNSGAPRMAATVKLADLIDNAQDIVTHDPNFAVQYLREKWLLLENMRQGDFKLRHQCMRILKDNFSTWALGWDQAPRSVR